MAYLSLLLSLTIDGGWTRNMDSFVIERTEVCNNLKCDNSSDLTVCGIRNEKTMVRLRMFANECALLKYGCSVEDKDAYGVISMEYCRRFVSVDTDADTAHKEIAAHDLHIAANHEDNNDSECETDCKYLHKDQLCGIRPDGEGYRVKLFENTCELVKYNCNATFPFIQTDMFICEGTLQIPSPAGNNFNNTGVYKNNHKKSVENSKRIIVVDGSMLGQVNDINETIENFFAATHVLDLPIREIDKNKLNTRRMLLKHVGPVKVFQPWITIPKKIKTDYFHEPTLSTCYHKCPTQCPDTYSPVCGVPGILAREPSIMFQNHCYMDVAQCKMFWENKSSTAVSSSYIESSFLFCLGDQLNGMYRFLPLVKTLQHMGRLKKKGKFRYRMINMRFFNNYAYKEPKLMG